MKKVAAPALLCLAYTAALAGFFSTDFAKKNSFFQSDVPATVVRTIAPVHVGIEIKQTLAAIPVVLSNDHLASDNGASPESASR